MIRNFREDLESQVQQLLGATNEEICFFDMILVRLDLDRVISAWEAATNADPASHKKGEIAKTCFVFAARNGWD